MLPPLPDMGLDRMATSGEQAYGEGVRRGTRPQNESLPGQSRVLARVADAVCSALGLFWRREDLHDPGAWCAVQCLPAVHGPGILF